MDHEMLMQHPNTLLHANGLPFINLASSFLPVDYNSINLPFITNNSSVYQEPTKLELSSSKSFIENMQSQLVPPPPMIERHSKTNVYIKGLPENFNDDSLEGLVPDRTKIKSLKAALEDDLRCKGYGFIDFLSEEDARHALSFIQGNNPSYNAKFAKENEKDKTNLYITNIPKEWSSKDSDKLKSYFEKYGPIQSAFIMMEKSTNKTVGVGFVRFVHEAHALKSLETIQNCDEYLPGCDRPLEAKFADKHNPETRKRRNPSNPVDHLTSVRSLNVGNCLLNQNLSLGNNLCGMYNQPFMIRNQNVLASTAPQVPLINPSAEAASFIDLAALYNLSSNQINYLYQNQLMGMPSCLDFAGSTISPLILPNGMTNTGFNQGSANPSNAGLDLLNYAQINNHYANSINITNYPSIPYSKNSSPYFTHSNTSIE